MQPRQQRHRAILPAQVRWNGGWQPARIQNVSNHGLMLRVEPLPPRGTYVDVAVGSLLITARTVWSDREFCGLAARMPIDFSRLRERRTSPAQGDTNAAFSGVDRRLTNYSGSSGEKARIVGNTIQFATAAIVAGAIAVSLSIEVHNIVSAPATAISLAMSDSLSRRH